MDGKILMFVLLLVLSAATQSHQRNIDGGKKNLNLISQERLRDSITFSQAMSRKRVGDRQLSIREQEDFDDAPQRRSIQATHSPSVHFAGMSPRALRSGMSYSVGSTPYAGFRSDIGVVLVDSEPLRASPMLNRAPPMSNAPLPPTGDTVVRLLRRTSGGILGELPEVPRRAGRVEQQNAVSKADGTLVNYEIMDEEGNTNFRQEQRDDDGTVRGSYGYQDTDGLYRIVDYEAGPGGFRANVRSNEPGMGRRNPAGVELTVEDPPPEVVARYNNQERPVTRPPGRTASVPARRPQGSFQEKPVGTQRPFQKKPMTTQRPTRQPAPQRAQISFQRQPMPIQRQQPSFPAQPSRPQSSSGGFRGTAMHSPMSRVNGEDVFIARPPAVNKSKPHLGIGFQALSGMKGTVDPYSKPKCWCENEDELK